MQGRNIMSKKALVGLEFELGNGQSLPEKEVTRCCFRVPVSKSDRVSIRIEDIIYPVVNMQSRGVAFRTRTESEYFPVEKQRINTMLTLKDKVFKVQAQVVHVSDDGEENPLCGLRFIDLDKETSGALSAFYEALRQRLLMSKGRSA